MKFLHFAICFLSIRILCFSQISDSLSYEEDIFVKVDEPAYFPGGIHAWGNYISKNLKYPKPAQRLGIEGRVFVQFIVEKDSSLSNIKVVKGIGGGCDEEALRIVKNQAYWIPGKQNGVPVRQKLIQNILFKFRNGKLVNDNSNITEESSEAEFREINLGLLVIDLDSYNFYGIQDLSLTQFAHPKVPFIEFLDSYVNSLIKNPKYLPASTSTSLTFTVFEDGLLGNFILGEEVNRNDTLFVETLLNLGDWEPSKTKNKSIFKLELKSIDQVQDRDARFPGGVHALGKYLNENLKFPVTSNYLYEDGHVIVEFFVEIDGKITNTRIFKGIGPAYDQEAIRVINNMPRWLPALENGIPIRQSVKQTVVYEVNMRHKTIRPNNGQ